MNEETQKLIDELTAAGATDEEIAAILDKQLSAAPQPPAPEAETPQPRADVFGNNPMIPDFVENSSLAKTIVSGLEDVIPQQVYGLQQRTASEKSHKAAEATDPTAYVHANLIDFQRYIREKKGLKWYQGFDENDWMQEAPNFVKDQVALNEKAAKLEGKIQEQKDQAQERLKGVVTDLRDINSATDAMSWAGHMIGQGVYQIPTSIATGGSSSFFMEAAIIYDSQLDALAEQYGISREEVVRRGLDDPAKGAAYAGIAGALDATSAGELFNIFRKAATKSLTKQAVNNFFKEGITEGIQGNLERLASNDAFDPFTHDNMMETLNETLGGGLGGTALGINSGREEEQHPNTKANPEAEIKEAEVIAGRDPATKTGDPALDDEIDADYADVAAQLDAIDVSDETQTPTLADVAKDIDEFSAINEENEILPDTEFTPQEAGALQAQQPIEGFASEENEIPTEVGTPQDIAAMQAAQVPVEAPVAQAPTEQLPTEAAPTAAPVATPIQPELNTEEDARSARERIESRSKEKAAKEEESRRVRLRKSEENRVEAEKRKTERFQREVSNTDKLKPGARQRRLQELNEATLDNPEINKQVRDKIEQLEAIRNDKAFAKKMKTATPEEKIDIISQRVGREEDAFKTVKAASQALTSDNLDEVQSAFDKFQEASSTIENSPHLLKSEQNEMTALANDVRSQFERKLEPKRKAEEESNKKAKAEGRATTQEKDAHLTTVAKAVTQALPGQVDLAVEAYQKWRSDHQLTPMSRQDILRKAQAEHYVSRAKKLIQGRATLEVSDAMKKAQEDIRKSFGLSEDADVELMGDFSDTEEEIQESISAFSDIKPVTFNDLFARIKSFYTGDDKFFNGIKSLVEFADKISQKLSKKGLEIYMGKTANGAVRGFHAYDANQGRNLMFIDENSKGDTDAHELIHYLVHYAINQISVLRKGTPKNSTALQLADATQRFYKKFDTIFKGARDSYRDQLNQLARTIAEEQELTPTQHQFMVYLQGYLQSLGYDEFAQNVLTFDQIVDILNNTYAGDSTPSNYPKGKLSYLFFNSDELLAEAFSNPFAMGMLSMLESPNKSSIGGKIQSYFRQMVEGLTTLLNELVGIAGIKFTPVNNNYMKEITDFMSSVEVNYLTKEAPEAQAVDDASTKIIQNMLGPFKPSTYVNLKATAGKRVSNPVDKIIKGLSNQWWKTKTINSLADVQAEVDKINALTTKNKLNKINVYQIWNRIQQYRRELRDAKTIQSNSVAYAKTLPEYKSSKVFQRDVSDFGNVDLDRLSIQKVRALEKGILELVMGGTPSYESFNIVNKDVAQKKLDTLLPSAGQFANDPKVVPFLPAVVSLANLSNPSTFATILAKYNTANAQKLFKTMYGGMLDARTTSQKEGNAFLNSLYAIVNKHQLSHSDFVKAQMFGNATTTEHNSTDPEYWDEVAANAAQIVANAESKVKAKQTKVYKGSTMERVQNELKIAKELQAHLAKKTTKGFLSSQQQELYDAFRDFVNKYQKDIATTQGVWGDDSFVPLNGYIPSIVLGREKTGDMGGHNALITNTQANNLFQAAQQGTNYGNVAAQQTGSRKEKVNPKGYFYDYNMMSVAHKYAPKMLFDIYGAREAKALNLVLNGVGKNGRPVSSNGKDIYAVMSPHAISGLSHQLQSVSGSSSYSDSQINDLFKQLFKAKDAVTKAVLATTGQFLVQASSAFPAAIIMSPKGYLRAQKVLLGFENGSTNMTNVKDFIDKNGLSIQLRDVLFERFITEDDVNKTGIARGLRKVVAEGDAITTYALRAGDKFAARLVWFSSFFDAGGTLDNPTVDAVLQAERAVGLLQNMSDVNFSAPIFRNNHASTRMLVHMFWSFKSFAMNSAINTYYGLRYSFSEGEARKIFAANVAMAFSYHLMAAYAIKPLYAAIASAFGGDDDDEEKNVGKGEEVAWNTLWDLAIGQMAPSAVDAGLRYLLGQGLAKQAKMNGETFNAATDSPIFIPSSKEDALIEGAGQYGTMYEAGVNAASGLATLTYREMDEDLVTEDQSITAWFDIMEAMFLLNGSIPMRGDIMKLMKNYEKRLKTENKTVGGSGESEFGTEFEVPEYDISVPSDPTEIPEYE